MHTKKHEWIAVLLAVAVAAAAQPAPADFKRSIDRGVTAFKAARYAEATDAFRAATQLKPDDVQAHTYLGTAYLVQWIPGAQSVENVALVRDAEAEFKRVLSLDPKDKTALEFLASMTFNQAQSLPPAAKAAKIDEAITWNNRLIEVDPQNKSAFYSKGVIAWAKFYPSLMQARASLRMKPEDPGPLPSPRIRADLLTRFGAVVDRGIADLKRAIELDPEYDDALAYLSLLLRERADLRDTKAAYKADIEIADEWLGKAINAKKAKGQRGESLTLRQRISPDPPGIPPPPPPSREPAPASSEPSSASSKPIPASSKPVPVGAAQMERQLIRKPDPVYPPKALEAHIQGVVRFNVIVAKDGTVENLQLVSGHPLLVQAARDAAKQYLYKPTLVEYEPARVVTTLEITFKLP